MENTIERKNFESLEKEGWQDETDQRAESVCVFIKNNFFVSSEKNSKYDSLSKLHLSGCNSDTLTKIREGSMSPEKINVLYENEEITQIHIVFSSEENGHNLDFYLTGTALEDYLAQ